MQGVGLGWVVAASGSVICRVSPRDLYKLLCNALKYPDHWVINIKRLHHPLGVRIRKNI
jgi:hypothetical protein